MLLLEDEEAVRALAQRILEQAGYVVHAASSPADAVARLGSTAFDVVVTDVIMPGQSGPDFVAGLDERLPVVFVSGYTGAGTARMHLERPTRVLVSKPFDPASLARSVRRVLDAAGTEDVEGHAHRLGGHLLQPIPAPATDASDTGDAAMGEPGTARLGRGSDRLPSEGGER